MEKVPPETVIWNREQARLERERVPAEGVLRFLYHRHLGRLLAFGLLSRREASRLYGWLQRRSWTRRSIPRFVENLGIDVSEADQPLSAYRSLDDFFTRRLRPEVRPVDPKPNHCVSPSDGRILVYPELVSRLPVKGCDVSLAELVGSAELAEPYQQGAAAVIRLAPADYHRFHFPDDGQAGPARAVRGSFHSVHPLALSGGAPSLLNQRTITRVDTDWFGSLLLIEVGALCVGTIVQTFRPGPVSRGQEKGYFRFGGSTIVVLWPPGRVVFDEDLVRNTNGGVETLVKMGLRVGVAVGSGSTPRAV